jgi:glutathione S-transferase
MPDDTLTLYHGLASTCSKKVRLTLFEKGLTFRSHLLDLQKFEQHDPGYVSINPSGVVPTLVHRGHIIVESSVIMEYLEDAYPEICLRPRDPLVTASIRLWLRNSDLAYEAVSPRSWMAMYRDLMRHFTEDDRERVLARIPTAERRRRWRDVSSNGMPQAELDAADEKIRVLLRRCETTLAKSSYLAGDDYTLADIAIVPFIVRIENILAGMLTDYPRVSGWLARLRARPAFAKAILYDEDPRAATMINI